MKYLVLSTLLLINTAIAKDLYFSNLVRDPELKTNWNKLIAGHRFRKYDSWIVQHTGLRGPVEYIDIEGSKFIKDEGCEPHDCTDNSIVILANTKTKQIWMVHRIISFPDRNVKLDFFGYPDGMMKDNLTKFLVKQ